MRRIQWSLVLLAMILVAAPARAQSFVFLNPNGFDYGVSGGSVTYFRHRHHSTLSVTLGGYAIGTPPVYGPILPTLLVPPSIGPVINQPVTVVNYRPPPIVVPPPFVPDDLTMAILPRREPEIPLNPRPLPEKKKPVQPEPPAKPAEPIKPPRPVPGDNPFMPHPNPAPRGENARLIDLGKESFADTDYGLAAQRFRQAAVVFPNDAQAYFLLAQSFIALGKYREAVNAIKTGMEIEPNWPLANYQPLALYGTHVAFYSQHLHRLADVVDAFPNDPFVLFLYGYVLWFDGRREEAVDYFRKALSAGADPVAVDAFLRAMPPDGSL